MTFNTNPHPDEIDNAPISIPDEFSPNFYLQPFVNWLNTEEDNVLRQVRLRLVWVHSSASDTDSIVTYGEIGFDGHSDLEVTMKLGVTLDMKVFLKGMATLYNSDARWGNASPNELSGLPFPFNPRQKSLAGITIWTQTGQVELDFASRQDNWKFTTKFEPAAQLLWGFPAGNGAPIVKPMMILSLAKQQIMK